jgi:predicted enzyme related to lactoylglutathione lyase
MEVAQRRKKMVTIQEYLRNFDFYEQTFTINYTKPSKMMMYQNLIYL